MNTNLIHLYRYGKDANLNSQQKIEITRPACSDILENIGNVDGNALAGDVTSGECVKEDVLIKDYLPAMKAICDKLEEASEKVVVVSDIKLALGYRKSTGHRAWRNILNRLKYAGLVEETQAEVNKRDVSCLRLLKKFDPKDFQPKTNMCGYDGFDIEHSVNHGKRGRVTDQFVELPIEHRIYDMVDAEGTKGITISEVCKRLELNAKRIYPRIIGMSSRFGLCMNSEIPNRTSCFRVWTLRNYQQHSTNGFPGNSEVTPDKTELCTESSDLVLCDQPSLNVRFIDSCSHNELLEKARCGQKELEPPSISSGLPTDAQVIICTTGSQNLMHESSSRTNDTGSDTARRVTESNLVSERPPSVASKSSKQAQSYKCLSSTAVGAQREQRILKRLENEKFILIAELYRWLENLEKDKCTTMDRKTLQRTLNKLQQEGLCKITEVTIPVVTNFNRHRRQRVILHSSVDNLSSDLLDQIYKRHRSFDIEIRGRGLARSKNNQPVTVLTKAKRSSNHVADKQVILESMRGNGFVSAKMVRVKLLHHFLWGYLSGLPDWQNTSNYRKYDNDDNLKNHRTTCQFAINAAIKEMPFELFLQIVGSPKEIDDMVDKCRLGLRLSDLPVLEYKRLMDTQATGRLSCIVDILLRLKLIQLVKDGLAENVDVLPHAVLSHAMELQPYIEEPLPRVLPSSNVSRDIRPSIRHDFFLSNREAVDSYWETLEYCYATADPAASLHAFPGSSVHEVFHPRSWASVRVMTAEQRMELLKRVTNDDLAKKISFKECVKIARELKLTLEQVLRVSYDKRQHRLHRYSSSSKSEKTENNVNANNCEPICRKRRRFSKDDPLEHNTDGATESHDGDLQSCKDDGQVNAAGEFKPHEEDGQDCEFVSQCALSRLKRMRRRRFSWTDSLDRQLVMQYARHRATLGARFFRVDWTSLPDLPTLPLTCGRRMAVLKSNIIIRRAVMRLCNLLGDRYASYLNTTWKKMEKETVDCVDSEKSVQGVTPDENEPSFQQDCWDDFEDPEINKAVDEVLRYKNMAKLEYAKRLGSRHEKVTWKEQNFTSSSLEDSIHYEDERWHKNTDIFSKPVRRRSKSHQFRGKFLKLLNSRGISIRRQVCESLAVSNAVELLKLVFLSNTTDSKVQTSLAATLQKYSESDLFAAFNFLKEKNYMVPGHGSRPFVLSQRFWHCASSSPFPIDSGKRAASFSSWVHKQDKEVMGNGVNLTSDLQCGEIFHLFALCSSGEVFISPCLPKEGIGEVDEAKSSKIVLPMDGVDDFSEPTSLKRKSDKGIPGGDEKVKKHKTQGKIDGDFCLRREKGFPGIKVLLNRQAISRAGAVQCSADEKKHKYSSFYEDMDKQNSYSDLETVCFPFSSSNFSRSQSLIESPWDEIVRYAAVLSSVIDGISEKVTFCPELFKSVHFAIHQAGEQGLSVEEISKLMGIKGLQLGKIVVDTLEVFQLATKVNAYDSVRVVDSSYKSKYFISILANQNHDRVMPSHIKSQGMSFEASEQIFQGKHDVICDSQEDTSMTLCDGHRVTILDSSMRPNCLSHTETQPSKESVTFKENKQVEAVPVKGNEASVPHVYQSILPWINGDGSRNAIVYKGLTRRVLGIVMQNPGILEEDIIRRMDVLNPQSCRQLLETMALDNHIIVRMMNQIACVAPPTILRNLFHSNTSIPESKSQKHFFANPMSTSLL